DQARKTQHRHNGVINPDHIRPTIYALSSSSGRILTEKENVCVGISMPYRNKNGAEKTFNARLPFASSGRLRQGLRGVSPRHVLSAWR
ncbi:hypothetical protein, partial [Pseudomonas aeruginosa]|uniref:hypothetical protein n=1 Tax=Pseudomonas aeruginosa TaxID=287 RepID=UPI002F948694